MYKLLLNFCVQNIETTGLETSKESYISLNLLRIDNRRYGPFGGVVVYWTLSFLPGIPIHVSYTYH